MPPLNIVPGDPSSSSTSVKPIPAPIVSPEQSKSLEQESLQRAQEIAEQLAQVVGPQAVPPAALGEQIDPQTGALMPSPTMMLMQATPPPEAEAAPAPGGAPAPEGQAPPPPPPPPEQKTALDANSVFRLAWEARTKSAALQNLVIDRPKGTVKRFQTPRGPEDAVYPVDYGYLSDIVNPDDQEGLDVFHGSGGPHYGRFMKGKTLDGGWKPDERKWYYGLTPEEKEQVLAFYTDQDPGLLQDHLEFDGPDYFLEDVSRVGAEKQANIGSLIRGASKLPSLTGKAFRGARSALGGLSRAKAPARPRSPLPKASPGGQATTVNYVPPAKNPVLQKTYVPPNPPSGGNMTSTAHYSGTRPFQNTPVRQGPASVKVPASSFPARPQVPNAIPTRMSRAPNAAVDAAQKGVGLAAIGGGLAGATYFNQKSDDWLGQLLSKGKPSPPQHMAQQSSLFGR